MKNEAENLDRCLRLLQKQTDQDFEVVIVDDASTDGSGAVPFRYFPDARLQILSLQPGEFTYPHACNVGAARARGEYLVYLSAHSFPRTATWLADGLNAFGDDRTAGVFAYPFSGPGGTLAEKLIEDLPNLLFFSQRRVYSNPGRALLGATNAIVRRDLWTQRPFNESFVRGSDDVEWANFWIRRGYVVVLEPAFRVNHSHHRSLRSILRQRRAWRKIRQEYPIM